MKRTLIGCLLAAILMISVSLDKQPPAEAAVSPIWFWILGQIISDARENPVESHVISLSPAYNVYSGGSVLSNGMFVVGNFEGACPNPQTTIAATGRGAVQVWDPGNTARVDILGFEMTSNSVYFPKKMGMYYKEFAEEDRFKKELAIQSTDQIVTDNPRFAKWQIPVFTGNLPQSLYLVKVRVWFTEKQASGLFKLGRSTKIQREETLCRFLVLDRAYMQRAVNDPQLQRDLQATCGLIGGPTTIMPMSLTVRPETINAMQMMDQMDGQAVPGANGQPSYVAPGSYVQPQSGNNLPPAYQNQSGYGGQAPQNYAPTNQPPYQINQQQNYNSDDGTILRGPVASVGASVEELPRINGPKEITSPFRKVKLVVWQGKIRTDYDATVRLGLLQKGSSLYFIRNNQAIAIAEYNQMVPIGDKLYVEVRLAGQQTLAEGDKIRISKGGTRQ